MNPLEHRTEYETGNLDEADLAGDPFEQFEAWYQQAVAAKVSEPNAMILATATTEGAPTQRTVLLKYFDQRGFVFFTNYGSRKATQIRENANVSLLFPWLALERQLEINGRAEKVSLAESIKYFATRPRGSQLGAWVSQQSKVMTSRSLLDSKLAEMKQKFSAGLVPLPSFWGGFRVTPHRFEFWQGRPDRLHDRWEYFPLNQTTWRLQRLSP